MTHTVFPAITIRWADQHRTFAPGPAVVIGRDAGADVHVVHPAVSRSHVVLCYLGGRWVAIDNQSLNGVFTDGERVRSLDIRGGETIRIGDPDGPCLAFKLGLPTLPDNRTTTPLEDDVITIGNSDLATTVTRSGLEAHGISLIDGETLLDRVSLSARPGSLTAVIGPSGAGKSTLSRVIAGASRPTSGSVSFDGQDVHATNSSLRRRIGVVPQDDVVHGRLTIARALEFAAELRMPGSAAQERYRAVARVLGELELTPHASTRIEHLSGGQRKRVSVAMELLTSPALLVLDEPTTGLDPALDRQVMSMLRRLADAGRVVVVITHSLAFLDVCDQVLLLAPGGRTAFCGRPDELGPAMGSTEWAEIFAGICTDPEGAQRRFLARRGTGTEPLRVPNEPPAVAAAPTKGALRQQFSTIARRQLRLLVANRGYLAFLIVLPFIVGLLPLTVLGDAGFGRPPADGSAPLEPKHVIALLNFAAVLMGTTLTVRDLVSERAIFRRDQSIGLSASAYLLAKVAVFGAVAALQGVALVVIVTLGKPAPETSAALGSPVLELAVGVAATCVAAAVLGLAVSSIAKTGDQVIVLLAAALAAQLVLAGGFIPVTGRPVLETVAAFTPGRWGFAATASTADLGNLVVGIVQDSHWAHTASAWWFDIGALVGLGALFAGVARWKLRRAR